jgi:Uma2 family endonuclease
MYAYPDVSVVCGTPQFTGDTPDTLANPTLIVEVLSPSTESYDRGTKSQHYRELDSLQEYLLIAQDSYRVEHYIRQQDGPWLLKDAVGIDAALELASIGCTLSLADVYEKVTFENEETPAEDAG